MKNTVKIGICALATAGLGAGAVAMASGEGTPTRQQIRAESLLEGKVAGEPQQCIQLRRIRHTTVVDESTILYRVNSRELYRASFDVPCGGLDNDTTLITDTNSTQLCTGDQVRVVENPTGRDLSTCAISSFTPFSAP